MTSPLASSGPGADVMEQPATGTDGRRDERIARLVGTLDFALRATDQLLNPPAIDSSATDSRPSFPRRAKIVCESALLLHLASAVPAPPTSLASRIDALADAITSSARSEETAMWIRLMPTKAAELGVAHLYLTALGHPDPDFHALYCHALTSTSTGSAERLAWKDLEAGWHRELGAPLPPLDLEAAARRTAYNQGQDVLGASREACYAVTHGIFYATGFGSRSPLLARDEGELLADVDGITARCLDDDDFDIAAEVLMTWPLMRARWSPTAIAALQVLDEVTDAYGFLPSITLDSGTFERLAPADQAAYYYWESYHTVYVSGMLQAAILSAGQRPAQRPTPLPHLDPVAERLTELLLPKEPVPQWEAVLHTDVDGERGALVPLLADIGVRRAFLAQDYTRAHEIVMTFLDAGLAPTSMVQRAGEQLSLLSHAVRRAA